MDQFNIKTEAPTQLRNVRPVIFCLRHCLFGLVLLVALIAMGGQVRAESGVENDSEKARRIERILALPFCDISTLIKGGAHIRGPLSGNVFAIDQVDPQAVEFMNAVLDDELQKGSNIEIQYSSSGVTSAVGVLPAAERREARIAAVQQLGRQEGADAVLCGFIYAFRDRQGGDLSIEKPARVVFELNLVDSESGVLIWQPHFKETQKTLAEDLFEIKKFFKRGGKWVTAKQMGRQALVDMFKTFPAMSNPAIPE